MFCVSQYRVLRGHPKWGHDDNPAIVKCPTCGNCLPEQDSWIPKRCALSHNMGYHGLYLDLWGVVVRSFSSPTSIFVGSFARDARSCPFVSQEAGLSLIAVLVEGPGTQLIFFSSVHFSVFIVIAVTRPFANR